MQSKTFLKEQINDLINQLELAAAIIKRQHQILVDHNIDPLTGNKNIGYSDLVVDSGHLDG